MTAAEPVAEAAVDEVSAWLARHADCLDRAAAAAEQLHDPRRAHLIAAMGRMFRAASLIPPTREGTC